MIASILTFNLVPVAPTVALYLSLKRQKLVLLWGFFSPTRQEAPFAYWSAVTSATALVIFLWLVVGWVDIRVVTHR